MKHRLPAFLSLVLLVAKGLVASPPETVRIAMNDGIELEASLFLPPEGKQHSTLLVRTPYGRLQHQGEAEFWASHGYAVLLQDTRGKFGSEGDFLPFVNELADGLATLNWIREQPWSDGRVGAWGSSYLAHCALALASSGHPSLQSIFVISGWLREDKMTSFSGANHLMLSVPWILHEESQTKRSLQDYEMEDLFEYLPLWDVFRSIGIESRIWTEDFDLDWLDEYSPADIEIPVFHFTGWNDFVYEAALDNYRGTLENGALQRLVIGPWFHDQYYTTFTEVGDEDFGPQSAMGRERLQELALRWFDHTLRGLDNGIQREAPVEVFVMGENRWRELSAWPPEGLSQRRWYLESSAGANSLAGEGELESRPPSRDGTDRFVFDPYNPVPSLGGASMHFFLHLLGVKDQREIEQRNDVLVYTSAPLEEDLTLMGPIEVKLFASTEAVDTDFTAKLVEVRSTGYARLIEEGIVRASFRLGDERELLTPGSIVPYEIDLGATAITLKKGHRLRLEISSSNFPKYDRNPNTGEDSLHAKTLHKVQQTIYHGPAYPSHVVLPVVELEEKK